MTARRALVTGAAGFVGRHLSVRLLEDGWHVVAVVRPGSARDALERVTLLEADVTELEPVDVTGSADVLFHLAAVGLHEPRPRPGDEVARINILGTLNAVRFAAALGVRRIVHVGSGLEYGPGSLLREDTMLRPSSVYAASKAASWLLASTLCRRLGVDLVGLRPFTIYGPGDSSSSLVGSAIRTGLAAGELELTPGAQTRDFVFVHDVVDALLAAASAAGASGEAFNVCTGVETSIRELVELVVELTGGAARPLFGALPYRDGELWSSSGDPAKARAALGWSASTAVRDGLGETIESVRATAATPAGVVK